MNDYIIKFKPKVVLFLVGINDVGRESLGKYPSDEGKFLRGRLSYANTLSDFFKLAANHSDVIAYALNLWRCIKAKSAGLGHETVNFNLAKAEKIYLGEREKQNIRTAHVQKLKDYEGRLKEIISICRVNNIEPVFITQPTLYGDVVDPITNIDLRDIKVNNAGYMDGSLAWEIMERYNYVVRKLGEKENVLVVDLARELPKSSKYYYDFVHYTNEGAKEVAEIVFKQIYPFLAKKYQESAN